MGKVGSQGRNKRTEREERTKMMNQRRGNVVTRKLERRASRENKQMHEKEREEERRIEEGKGRKEIKEEIPWGQVDNRLLRVGNGRYHTTIHVSPISFAMAE